MPQSIQLDKVALITWLISFQTDKDNCPCGPAPALRLLRAIINGEREPNCRRADARSLFAFATGAIDFIVASTHSRTRPEIDVHTSAKWSQTSTWRGLQIFETKLVDNKAVSFEALYIQAGKDQSHKEKGQFERENGKWRFLPAKN